MKGKLNFLKTISFKMAIIYAIFFSIILIILNSSIISISRYFIFNEARNQIKNVTMNLSLEVGSRYDVDQMNLYDKRLLKEIPLDENLIVNILNSKGKVINASLSKIATKLPIGDDLGVSNVEYKNTKFLCKQNKVITADNKVVYVQVFKSMTKEYKFLDLLFELMAIADCLGVIISFFAGFFISKNMLKPINNVTTMAQNISIHDLNNRIEVPETNDEVARLAKTFNEMIARLQDSFNRQNQFVSDASHELRTPISVINGYINMLDRWGKEDEVILKESIDVIKSETINMSNLIERLLFLAREDMNRQILDSDKFSANELITEIVKETRIIDTEHNIINGKNSVGYICADRKLIKQMVRALIENSMKFTPAGGDIQIDSIIEDDSLLIIIKDSGIGINQEDIPKLFDRFYRVDKVRTKNNCKGGTGLGLSIVKTIAQAHNGDVMIQSEVDRGTKVTIKLPLAIVK